MDIDGRFQIWRTFSNAKLLNSFTCHMDYGFASRTDDGLGSLSKMKKTMELSVV